MLKVLEGIPAFLNPLSEIRMEVFRGDSFQLEVNNVRDSLRVAVIIRALLRGITINKSRRQLDCRVALGIGDVTYDSNSVSTSDGEAYRLSGRTLDEMESSRLMVATCWDDINAELDVETALADGYITKWKSAQSRIMATYLLKDVRQEDLATELGLSRQMINKTLKSASAPLIKLYIKRFETLINERI